MVIVEANEGARRANDRMWQEDIRQLAEKKVATLSEVSRKLDRILELLEHAQITVKRVEE